MFFDKIISILGIIFICFVLWLFSENRKEFPFRIVLWGFILMFAFGFLVLNFQPGVDLLNWFGQLISQFLEFSKKGTEFLFGNIGKSEQTGVFGYQFAIIITGTIIFFSAVVSALYHYKIMQKLVYAIAYIMHKTMKTGGAETLSAASNIFLGQLESPLMIRHYLKDSSRSEILTIMVTGLCTIAGGVMAAFIQMGISPTDLMISSIISTPCGIMLSKILIPPLGNPKSLKEIKDVSVPPAKNVIEAISNGAIDGLQLSLSIMAVIVAFISIIAMLDYGFLYVHDWLTAYDLYFFPKSLNELLGLVFQPFAYLAGIPSGETELYGSLIGTQVSVNEFVAYNDLALMVKNQAISPRTAQIATYALCSFANFGSVAILIGGLGSLEPLKKSEVAQLGLKALIVGILTNQMTAIVASILI